MSLAPKIERIEGPLHVSLLPPDIKVGWCFYMVLEKNYGSRVTM
jgi:hypothetical protein